jgi:hypothetical protein
MVIVLHYGKISCITITNLIAIETTESSLCQLFGAIAVGRQMQVPKVAYKIMSKLMVMNRSVYTNNGKPSAFESPSSSLLLVS